MPERSSEVQYNPNHLPHSDGAEQYCLGACMLSKAALLTVCSSLVEEDFFTSSHRQIYRAIVQLNTTNIEVNIQTVGEVLESYHAYESVGGPDYLNECCDVVTTLESLDFNISLVNNYSVLRNVLISMRDIDHRAGTEDIEDLDIFIAEAEKSIRDAAEKRTSPYFSSVSEVAKEVQEELNSLENVEKEDEDVIGVTTGFKRINQLTQGFKKDEVTIIGARPSVGKTALSLNFAFNAATMGHVSVAIFSLEMDKKQLVRRLVASSALVNLTDISIGTRIRGNNREKVYSALSRVASAPIYIDDTPGQRLSEIENKAKKLKASDPNLGLIVVDYLGLIAPDKTGRSNDNRQEEVRKASLAIKNLARELHVPIILVCQLNRGVDERGRDHRPQLSDLRESGAIEQDADVVMLLYRQDYYNRVSKRGENKKYSEQTEGERMATSVAASERLNEGLPEGTSYVELIIAKNRNGETGTVPLFFRKNYGKYEAPTAEWEKRMAEERASHPDFNGD
ncbi:MAG: replicative DNA helicase [Coprobacillus sp.]|nr:replicative DNA helicase [Coprobacillus sp.]